MGITTKTAYERAQTKVKRIKGFYNHLFIYILFLVLWFALAGRFMGVIGESIGNANDGFIEWANINLWLNPLIWGLIVVIHALYVFGKTGILVRKWEDRKMQEFMNEEVEESTKRYE